MLTASAKSTILKTIEIYELNSLEYIYNGVLLETAQKRVRNLITGYIKQISNLSGKEFNLKWNYYEENKTENETIKPE